MFRNSGTRLQCLRRDAARANGVLRHAALMWRTTMYAITGITGKVGGELARTLLAAGQPVRAIVRDERKGEPWAVRGCELAVAEMEDPSALTAAFLGATTVFILPPSEFDPEPGYP